MKKKLVTFVAALLALAPRAMAGDGVWLECNDGTKLGYLFTEEPKITYTATELVMKTTSATAQFPLSDLKRLYFADDVTNGIDTAKPHAVVQLSRSDSNGVELSGFLPGAPVMVYDITGKLISRQQVGQSGQLSVSLSALPQGTYIIKADKTTLKIQKK